jgi:hypothetical protein
LWLTAAGPPRSGGTAAERGVGGKDFPRVGNYSKPRVLKERVCERQVAGPPHSLYIDKYI